MFRNALSTLIVAIVGVCGLFGAGGCLMSETQEISMGAEVAPQFESEGGGRYPNEEVQNYVQSVGMAVVAELTPDERRIYEFKFTLLNSDAVNAFALPGGPIYITRGLLVKLEDEDELAAVLGHETAHVVQRHVAYHVQRATGFNLALFALDVFLQSEGAPGYVYDVSNLVVQLTDLKFSRTDESEADMSGLEYMHRAGYDPRGMGRVMTVLKASGGGATLEFFSTHPDPDNRLEAIDARIAKEWPALLKTPANFRKDKFQKMLAGAGLSGAGTGYAINGEADKLRLDAEQAFASGDKTTADKLFRQAEEKYTAAIDSLKTHATPYLGRAQARWRLGRLGEALGDLDKALGFEPNHHAARVVRGRLRIESGDNVGALEDMNQAIRQVPTEAKSYFYRGKAFFRLQRRPEAIDDMRRYLDSESTGPLADEARDMLRQMGAL